MMETDETPQPNVTEPQVTKPMDKAESLSPNPPVLPSFDQNRFFTLEDIPPSQWRTRILEILAWAQVQLQKPLATHTSVIAQLPPRLLGRLKDWWVNLGEYRQMQALQSVNIDTFLALIHHEFIGAQFYHTDQQREEFFQMKCCSFKRKDLERHYSNMSSRFYVINGLDDPNFKQAFLNSLPEPLGNERAKILATKNLSITTASLGEIYQNSLLALEKFCNTSKFLKQIESMGKKIGSACRENNFSIKCKEDHYDCKTSKKAHYQKIPSSEANPSKRWKFLKKKKFLGKTTDHYFICKKKGHFARHCPKKARAAHLLQQAQDFADPNFSNLESQFSLEDEYSPDSLLVVPCYSFEDEEPEQPLQYNTEMVTPTHLVQPTPTARISICSEPFARPIPVIAYFDTGAAATIINPHLLPDSHWKTTRLTFKAVNGELFQITKISKLITIQIFSNLKIQHQVLGCKLTSKDLLIGFDILHQFSSL